MALYLVFKRLNAVKLSDKSFALNVLPNFLQGVKLFRVNVGLWNRGILEIDHYTAARFAKSVHFFNCPRCKLCRWRSKSRPEQCNSYITPIYDLMVKHCLCCTGHIWYSMSFPTNQFYSCLQQHLTNVCIPVGHSLGHCVAFRSQIAGRH